jgi:hypothetical protein
MNQNRFVQFAGCGLLLAVMVLSAAVASGATIRVPFDQSTVADAIAIAGAGDDIRVANTHVDTGRLAVSGKDISIVSYDGAYATPTAGATINSVSVGGSTLALDGLTIGGGGSTGALAAVLFTTSTSSVSVDGCALSSSDSQGVRMLAAANGSTLTMTDSSASNNSSNGILIDNNTSNMSVILNNVDVNSNGSDGCLFIFGALIGQNHSFSATDCEFNDNVFVGLALGQGCAGTVTVTDSVMTGNNGFADLHIGWEADGTPRFDVTGCTIGGGPTAHGISVQFLANSVVNIADCTVTGAGNRGISITDNINVPVNVTDSTVTGSTNDGIFIDLLTPVTTAISIDNTTSTNNLVGMAAPQSNLTVTNSRIVNNTNWGAFLFAQVNDRTINVSDTQFNGNGFDGISIDGPQILTFTDCEFIGNFNGALIGVPLTGGTKEPELCRLTMDGCTVSGNVSNGLWMKTMDIDADITDSTFSSNGNNSLIIEEEANATAANGTFSVDVTMERCIVRGASAQAARVVGDTVNIINCLFDEGSANPGAIPALEDAVLTLGGGANASLVHCTVADSQTATTPATKAINMIDGTLSLQNSIVSAPGSTAIALGGGGSAGTIDYNLYQAASFGPGFGGSNSKPQGADPLFSTASSGVGTGDFHLMGSSPAIESGNPGLGVADDLEGASRPSPAGTWPDMGAYEEQTVPVELGAFTIE